MDSVSVMKKVDDDFTPAFITYYYYMNNINVW